MAHRVHITHDERMAVKGLRFEAIQISRVINHDNGDDTTNKSYHLPYS